MALAGHPPAWAASPAVRGDNATSLETLIHDYPATQVWAGGGLPIVSHTRSRSLAYTNTRARSLPVSLARALRPPSSHPPPRAPRQPVDTGATALLRLPWLQPLPGTLDGWLLRQWYNGSREHTGRWLPFYDAFFLDALPPDPAAPAADARASWLADAPLSYTVLTNQTAIHGLPAALSQVRAASAVQPIQSID